MDIRRAGTDYFSGSPSRAMERDDGGIQNQLEATYSRKELIRTSHRWSRPFTRCEPEVNPERVTTNDEPTAKNSYLSRKMYFGRSQSCFRGDFPGDIRSDLAGVDNVIFTSPTLRFETQGCA